MCGIIGVVCNRRCSEVLSKPLGTVVKEALLNLEYRGYDSVGFAIVDEEGKIIIKKSRGKIHDVERMLGFDEYDGSAAIGHTRWATHGEPSDSNAHPHTDCLYSVAVVHNGIIHNHHELKRKLIEKGHLFKSETDSEIVPHLIEELMKEGCSTLEAIRCTAKILRGAYALAIIVRREPAKIYFIRNVSPLIIGVSKDSIFIASDIPAFLKYTSRIIILEDGDFGYASFDSIYIENIYSGEVDWRKRVRIVDWTPEMAVKGGFPHFMLKEIHEQPVSLRNTIESLGAEVTSVAKMLISANRIFLTGCGTSFHAALIGEYMLSTLCGLPAISFVSSEYLRFRKIFTEGDILVAVSQSGETIDTLMAVREAKRRGAKVVAIANVLDSAIPRESDATIYTRAGPEIGVAATKTFTSQLLVFTILATEVAKLHSAEDLRVVDAIRGELREIHTIISGIIYSCEPRIRRFAEKIKDRRSAFYLGRGIGVPISMEGALKLKEVAYIHAEAYPAGESKHGPIALVEEGFPTFFTIFNDEYREQILGNIEEMKARKALTIGLVPKGYREAVRELDIVFEMPALTPYTSAIAYTIPYQLTAYYTAVVRGLDPDKPRNLAKTVTVE
ncbi:MAG: glutamine--fructose-6-phosphate transaminase (isomerizing) [Ignisphaera sp.]|nr:glutamine--fructose-6-phosphate transaminase (isomerizing) [Ignisphaera sp.]